MKPLDPRLLRYARRARLPIAGLAAIGVITAGLVIVQAQLLASAITGAFTRGATLEAASGTIIALAVVVAARAVTAWAGEAVAHLASAAAISELRRRVLARAVALGPSWLAGQRSASLTALATTGIDDLDGYFTGYLPKLFLAAVVPLAVLATITAADPWSGLVVALTLPLAPLFGALIGLATARHARDRWQALGTLAHHFHDVVAGLATLKVFGRAQAQRESVSRVTGDYRRATMATLRLAFLSAFALELIATTSVALVAVEVGLRLAGGTLGLRTGLLVLILAPEAYLPLRNASAQFHATADGLAAADEAFAILEAPAPGANVPGAPPDGAADSTRATPEVSAFQGRSTVGVNDVTWSREHRDIGRSAMTPGWCVIFGTISPKMTQDHELGRPYGEWSIVVDRIAVRHEGRAGAAPDGVSLTITPGRITALAGPSGCGKSTLVSVLLGFTRPDAGRVLITAKSAERADPAGAEREDPGDAERGGAGRRAEADLITARGGHAGLDVAGLGIAALDLAALDLAGLDGWRARVGWVPQEPTLARGPWPATSGSAGRRRPTTPCGRRPAPPRSTTSRWTGGSATWGPGCPLASGGAWRWPAPCYPARRAPPAPTAARARSCCSTSRPPGWTRRPRPASSPRCVPRPLAAAPSWS